MTTCAAMSPASSLPTQMATTTISVPQKESINLGGRRQQQQIQQATEFACEDMQQQNLCMDFDLQESNWAKSKQVNEEDDLFRELEEEVKAEKKQATNSSKGKKIVSAHSANIGELQKSDGSWDKASADSLKQHYKLGDKAFDELVAVLNGNLDLLLTVLALHWLESEKNVPENVLIIRKAREWIRKECSRTGVTNDQISTVKNGL